MSLTREQQEVVDKCKERFLSDEEEREHLMQLEKQANNDSEENKRIKSIS